MAPTPPAIPAIKPVLLELESLELPEGVAEGNVVIEEEDGNPVVVNDGTTILLDASRVGTMTAAVVVGTTALEEAAGTTTGGLGAGVVTGAGVGVGLSTGGLSTGGAVVVGRGAGVVGSGLLTVVVG
ncbi:hypothetical protein ABG067_009049, partial [Albugo candida]